jgi:hypothetical protein
VVAGYGLVKKRDLTGSVASIKGSEITKSAVSSPEQGLQALKIDCSPLVFIIRNS